MRRLEAQNSHLAQQALREEFKRSAQSRFEHRLHCVLLIAAGRTCADVADLFGDDRRTVQRWVGKFQDHGVDGLREASRAGRPAALADAQLRELGLAIREDPRRLGHSSEKWHGDLLCAEIFRRFGISLSARHCQRLFAALRHRAP